MRYPPHFNTLKRYLPKNVEDASALVLTLLVIVLLSAIVTAFLSSTRTEQTATRNYTSKVKAEMFATSATQQAMAKIQLGFNTKNATSGSSSGNNTQIVTTQPGRIMKYFFLNGNCTGNATTALYTENGTTRADMNNFQNPGNTTQHRANVSANQSFTITGNATNRLIVNMENVTSNGTLVGRIAYYVDDELTKINMNAATGNRSTLNVSTPRSNSLSGLTSNNSTLTVTSSQITLFQNVIDGNGANSSILSNWSHFFRNEQLSPSTTFNAAAAQLAQISTAPLSDFHLKYTPWGTRRLHINDEPLNATGVNNVYEALAGVNATTGNISASSSSYELNGRALRNIYGQTFNDKYGQNWSWTGNMSQTANTTVNGLKQTIANMLQMRTAGTAVLGYAFKGAVISENSTMGGLPAGYCAHTPFACINEFGIQADYQTINGTITLNIRPFVEIVALYFNENRSLPSDGTTLQVSINDIVCDGVSYGNATLSRRFYATNNSELKTFNKIVTNGMEGTTTVPTSPVLKYSLSQNFTIPSVPGNISITMGDVKLFAGNSTNATALRDWISGNLINSKFGDGSSFKINPPGNSTTSNSSVINRVIATANFNSGNTTLQRIDPKIKGETAWATAPYTYSRNGSLIYRGMEGNTSGEPRGGHNAYYKTFGLAPSETGNRDIPGDPSPKGDNECDYFITSEHTFIHFPQKLFTLDSYGNATFNTPHDLGKVPTNVNWRRLRFMPRHQRESARNLIPDWAMLDVISFSSNNSSRSNLKIAPINPNGNFALDMTLNTSNTTIPSPRNNLTALIKPLESSTPTNFKLGSSISGANMTVDMSPTGIAGDLDPSGIAPGRESNNYTYFRGNATLLASLLSSNIQNRVWSTQNGTWGGNATRWRESRQWPANQIVLPGEVTEISGVADYGIRSQYIYSDITPLAQNNSSSIKQNEGRLSAFFPGLTLQSNFFTIYAYAQALDRQGNIDSEALTKTLVEVEIAVTANATTQAQYKVKKLYTQPILMGE